MGRKLPFILPVLLLCFSCGKADFSESVMSPDGKVGIDIFPGSTSGGGTRLYYSVSFDGISVVDPSLLGFVMDGYEYGRNVRLVRRKSRTLDESYVLSSGKRTNVRNYFKETVLTFKDG